MSGIRACALLRLLRHQVISSQRFRSCIVGSAPAIGRRCDEAKGGPHQRQWIHPQAFILQCSASGQSGAQMPSADIKRAIDNISEKFSEAMELMSDARSSSGTVYFSEDMEDTRTQVKDTLHDYNSLLEKLSEEQRKGVIQSVGLKMEELKAQMSLLEEMARE